MVGYDPSKRQLSLREQAIISSSTSLFTRFLIQPFDVVKIRFQVQYEPISTKSYISKYQSIPQTFSTIVKEEGLFALWKGHLTGQVLSLSYNSAQFIWFEILTNLSYKFLPASFYTEDKRFLTHFICGGIAASFTIVTNQPVDTVRTRLVTQGEPRVYNGIMDAVRKIYAREGVRGFYKGTLPALMLVAPESAFRFGIYQYLNLHWTKLTNYLNSLHERAGGQLNQSDIGLIQSSINGSLAGVLSKTIVYPFDLAKKRLQIQGFEEAREPFGRVVKFTGMFNCFYLTIKKEGFFGIYKGYLPSMLKAGVSSGLIFLFYERFTYLARNMKSKNL